MEPGLLRYENSNESASTDSSKLFTPWANKDPKIDAKENKSKNLTKDQGNEKNQDKKGCDDCLPEWLSCVWFGSAYTWYFIIITVAALYIVLTLGNKAQDDEWFSGLTEPFVSMPYNAHATIWSIIFMGMLISVVLSAWNPDWKFSFCIALIYTFVILYTIFWSISFYSTRMHDWAIAASVGGIITMLWLIWLVYPKSCNGKDGGSRQYFSFSFFWLVLAWFLLTLYYTVSYYVMNESPHRKEPKSENEAKAEDD